MANRERAKAAPCVRRWEPTIFFLLLELVVYCYGCCCHGAVAVACIGGVGIAVVVGCPRRWLLLVFFFLFICATSQDLSLKKRREQLGFGAGNVCDMGSCLVITSF